MKVSLRYFVTRFQLVACLSLALGACTGGGGDNTNVATATDKVDLTAYGYWINGTQLFTTPRVAGSSVAASLGNYLTLQPIRLLHLRADDSVSNEFKRSVTFFLSNNHFYRLPLYSSSLPVAEQISTEGHADSICQFRGWSPDSVRYSQSIVKYALPGPDGSCLTADDEYRELRIAASSTEPPLSISKDRFEANNVYSLDGALQGALLTRDTGESYWFDKDFSSLQLLTSQDVASIEAAGQAAASVGSQSYFLLDPRYAGFSIDGLLNVSAKTLTRLRGTLQIDQALGYVDDEFLFQSSSIGAGQIAVYRLPVNGSASPRLVAGQLSGVAGLVGDELVVKKSYAGGDSIFSLNLRQPAASLREIKRTGSLSWLRLAGGRIYYYGRPLTGSLYLSQVGSLMPDGSDEVVYDQSVFAGVGYANSLSDKEVSPVISAIYLVRNPIMSSGWSGGNLQWLSINTGKVGGDLGAMPNQLGFAFGSFVFESLEVNGCVLGSGTSSADHLTHLLRACKAPALVDIAASMPSQLINRWVREGASFR